MYSIHLLGYGFESWHKGYRLYDQTKKWVLHSRDVIFNETTCGFVEDQEYHVSEKPLIEVQVQTESSSEDNIEITNQDEPEETHGESSQALAARQSAHNDYNIPPTRYVCGRGIIKLANSLQIP